MLVEDLRADQVGCIVFCQAWRNESRATSAPATNRSIRV